MRRNGLSVRATTSVGQHLPGNWPELVAKFRKYVKEVGQSVRPKDLGNMDEVPVSFDMPGNYTVEERGTQDVSIATTGKLLFSCSYLCIPIETLYNTCIKFSRS